MINSVKDKTFRDLPVKVLQFGEGNFLRAFADWIVESMNRKGIFNGSVAICQPIEKGLADLLNQQDCVYTVIMRGKENGQVTENVQVVTSVKECVNPYTDYEKAVEYACLDTLEVIISNTTEAGISYHEGDRITDKPPFSYPAKLTALLYERFKKFNGDINRGLLICPVELIEKNGDNLKKTVLKYAEEWQLPCEFIQWIDSACCFANTLVDRIVTGYPRDEADALCEKFGYKDNCLDTCELFLFWAIECDPVWANRFPVDKTGFNIIFSKDITEYKTRKVRILNGAHTVSVLAAYQCGYDIVLQMMNDGLFRKYIKKAMFEEIIPTINLPEKELADFANAVIERFDNPFIKHRLLDISLNSVSKYKARCLCTLLDYYKTNGELPAVLTFGLAALMCFYNGEFENGKYYGQRNGEKYEIRDDLSVLEFMNKAWHSENTVKQILSNVDFWGRDLTEICGMEQLVSDYVDEIKNNGVKYAVEKLIK